jgi:hypothetical protein
MGLPTISTFLNLPLEIRMQIYGYVLHSENPILLLSRRGNDSFRKASHSTIETLKVLSNEPFHIEEADECARQIDLFRVCRQIYAEARPIFFAKNTFTIPLCGWLPWIRPAIIPRREWNMIRHVKVTIYIQPSSSIKYCGMSGSAWLDNELSLLCNERPQNLSSLRSLIVVVKPVCYLSFPGGTVRPQWLDDCLSHCVTPLTKLKQLQEVKFLLYAELSEEKQQLAWNQWKAVNYAEAEADLDSIKVSFKGPRDSFAP